MSSSFVRIFPLLILSAAVAGGVYYYRQQQESAGDTSSGVQKTALSQAILLKSSDSKSILGIDSASTGALLFWKQDGRPVVDQSASPLSIELEDGSIGTFRFQKVEKEGEREVVLHGELEGVVPPLAATIRYTLNEAGNGLSIRLKTEAAKELRVSQWRYPIPLTLERHKKVYFRGENGLDWESRYTYQFHLSTAFTLLASPDVNEWGWFSAEQLTPTAFNLWKAESNITPPVMMQQGQQIAPYTQVYDRNGGLTVEYPQMKTGNGRGLQVDAREGGTVYVGLQTLRPLLAPENSALGNEHEIILHAHVSEAEVIEKRKVLNEAFPRISAVSVEPQEAQWLREAPMSRESHYVSGGVPFPRGAVQRMDSLAVSLAGKPVPFQANPLGYWPDGSVKWALFTVPFQPMIAGEASGQTPRITLRNGASLPLSIHRASSAVLLASSNTLTARMVAGGDVEIRNGDHLFRFSKGSGWLSARVGDQSLFTTPPSAYIEVRRHPDRAPSFGGHLQGGEVERCLLSVTDVTLEEAGPLRAVVRLEGDTGDNSPAKIILRATFLAGRPEIKLTHTAELKYIDPRKTFITAMGVELPLAGLVEGNEGLVQESFDSQWTYGGAKANEAAWLEASLENGIRFQGGIRHAAEMAPKALIHKGRAIRYELWPEVLPFMDTRRYSNRQHNAQGESTDGSADWVEKWYYENEPVVGVSRTHELFIGLWPEASAPALTSLAADFESPALLYPGWENCLRTRVVAPASSAEGWPMLWAARDHFTRFWLHHRHAHRWYGFWNFGDFRHRFRSGYGWVTTPEALAEALSTPEKKLPENAPYFLDYAPANDWAYDNGRWGWSNTEGLANLFLQQEYLRTGNRAVYFVAEAMARYCRDVVIRHDGKWVGAGTRHGAQPWSDGNHEERQTTTAEFRLHYFLSGDERSREVVNKLYKLHYSNSSLRDEAGHSGRWGGLFFHHELTGSPEEAEQLRRYAAAFISPKQDGIYFRPYVSFPGPKIAGTPESLNQVNMFFSCFGGLHYLLEYQQTFEDAALKAALLKVAEGVIAEPAAGQFDLIYTLPVVAFAAQHHVSPQPYRDYLKVAMGLENSWQMLYQSVSANPVHWSGPTARLMRNSPGVFFWANWVPYLTSPFASDEVWSEKIAADIKQFEQNGAPAEAPLSPWQQADYDALISPEGTYTPISAPISGASVP